MNCPSRTDEPPPDAQWNQNPRSLSADLTTRQDLNGIVNLRTNQDGSLKAEDTRIEGDGELRSGIDNGDAVSSRRLSRTSECRGPGSMSSKHLPSTHSIESADREIVDRTAPVKKRLRARNAFQHFWRMLVKFSKFIGPGFIISVAYIDPGNYSTDVAAGAATRFKLLFIVLMSNIFAIVLQSLAVRLGTVTGLNLAEHCRAHLPRWLNVALYILGEAAIIATDIAEVIGSAIALNLLLKIPLVAGCAITLVDVLVILIFYSPTGSMRRLRAFEYFVMALVLGVVICFCIQLSLISSSTSVTSVFAGYLPSAAIVEGNGLYLSCGILGATVMPHSLYLGSGMVQSRLREFDTAQASKGSRVPSNSHTTDCTTVRKARVPLEGYRPSLRAINHCLTYSTTEVALALFTFALFVNSAILIVAGASLYTPSDTNDTSSLFSVHDLLSHSIAPAAGTIFALALLLSGTSAGIVCTIAGQMLSEGALQWTVKPWIRRLLTRSISITPSIIIAGAVGKGGLTAALNATQVALSVVLPFVSAPLIYFTCRNKYMIVGGRPARQLQRTRDGRPEVGITDPTRVRRRGSDRGTSVELEERDDRGDAQPPVKMRNHMLVSVFAVLIWLVIAVMNVALLVLAGLGKA